MVEVSKEQFYKVIYDHDLDICVYAQMNTATKMMTTKFEFRNGELFGRAVHNYDLDSDDYGKQVYTIESKWIKEDTHGRHI